MSLPTAKILWEVFLISELKSASSELSPLTPIFILALPHAVPAKESPETFTSESIIHSTAESQ